MAKGGIETRAVAVGRALREGWGVGGQCVRLLHAMRYLQENEFGYLARKECRVTGCNIQHKYADGLICSFLLPVVKRPRQQAAV